MVWYKQTTESLYQILETSENGLSTADAQQRLQKYGPNQLSVRKQSIWSIIIEPFRSVFVLVLMVAAAVSLLSNEVKEVVIITSIIVINAVVFYNQQYATSRVLRTLKKNTEQKARVSRNGKDLIISSSQLVPGDIIFLSEGDKIPADARIVHTDSLQINESSLTGESVPVHKHASTLDSDKQVYEQDNMIFQGTYVIAGAGTAVVVETGSRTEYGKIADLASDETSKSPVQQKIDNLITLLIRVVAVLALIVFLLALSRGIPANEALRFVLSLSVSAVPEGLPIALTVILVLGMRRMAKKKALVRSFKAIEDIGLITTIATDKTGTLTKNHLSVIETWGDKSQVNLVAHKSVDINSKNVDPIDNAIFEYVNKKHPVADRVYPFDISLRMSGAYVSEEKRIYIKGSPEHLLGFAKMTKSEHSIASSAMHEMAAKGYRVIGFGYIGDIEKPLDDLSEVKKKALKFVGFLAFADELREQAPAAIRAAKDAGITVRMITGDHYETAYNIGKRLGLVTHKDAVIQGTQLPKGTKALALAISDKTVFARILPEDKYRILKALKQTEITAMTGDGVNDVPALSNAHVGIAMGSGSDIAKDAGGIVLLNDNFSTIVSAIAEGRKIYDNIRRMLFYLLSTSLGEVFTMIGALLFALPLPVTAIQILWINLVTDTALVIPLGLEPAESGNMKKPPRAPNDPLLSKLLKSRIVIVALTMATVSVIIIWYLKGLAYSTPQIQTVVFMSLIVAQWANAFNARSETESLIVRMRKPNLSMFVGLSIAVTLQMMVMVGPLRNVFNIQIVSAWAAIVSALCMLFFIFAVVEVHKLFARRKIERL